MAGISWPAEAEGLKAQRVARASEKESEMVLAMCTHVPSTPEWRKAISDRSWFPLTAEVVLDVPVTAAPASLPSRPRNLGSMTR